MQKYKQNPTHQTLTPHNNTKMRFFNNKQPKMAHPPQYHQHRTPNCYKARARGQRATTTTCGVIAVKHFNQNFRDSGFRNNGLRPWPETRRQREGKGADRRRKPLISAAPHLKYTTNINNEVPLSSKKVVRM